MSSEGNRFRSMRGKSSQRRTILLACGAVCNAAMLSFMVTSAHAQTAYTWSNSSGGNWSVGGAGGNWSGSAAPPPGIPTNGDVDLTFNAPGSYTSNNDLTGSFGLFNTTFTAGNGTTNLTGGELDFYNPASEPLNPVFTNDSTNPVTINNNIGYADPAAQGAGASETFLLVPGSTTTFNGTMNLTGGGALVMSNGETSGSGGAGGTMIWTQPVTFTNNPNSPFGGYFPFRIYEGTFEMGGYTLYNGNSDAPLVNIDGVNVFQTNGINDGAITDMYIGPEDFEHGFPNDVASFFLTTGGDAFNTPVQIGDAGTITIGGVNTSGTVYFNDFFKTLPTDGNGIVNGKSETIYYSAAAGGTVVENFNLVGGGAGGCGASVDKVGPGTWVIAGGGDNPTGAQAYTGNTTVRDGTLELAYDDTGTGFVTFPAAVLANPNANYYANGNNGGSLGYNAATTPVQLGDTGTLATDNIALLTLVGGSGGPRLVVHYIDVNAFNSSGTTTIGVGDNGTGNFQGNVLLNESAFLTGGTGGVANFSGNITGAGGITANGTGTVNLTGANSYLGSTNVASGTLVIGTNGALPGNSVVSVSNGGVLQLGTGTGLATMSSLTVAATGKLDVNNNHVILKYGATDPASTIYSYLKTGYSGGTWTGPGIDSSAAALPANNPNYGVGFVDGKDGVPGASVTSGQILIAYALYGDVNLDGLVNATDFAVFGANFNTAVTGWDKGDFTYTGLINATDFALLGANFGKSASGAALNLPSSDFAALDAFAAANGLALPSVPEPASVALMAAAGLGMLARRRRRESIL